MDSNLLIRWRVILDYQSQGRGGCWPFLSLSSLRSVRTEPQPGSRSRLDKQRIMKECSRLSCPLPSALGVSLMARRHTASHAKLIVGALSPSAPRMSGQLGPGLFSMSNVAPSFPDASVALLILREPDRKSPKFGFLAPHQGFRGEKSTKVLQIRTCRLWIKPVTVLS